MGEAFNRVTAYLTVREHLLSDIAERVVLQAKKVKTDKDLTRIKDLEKITMGADGKLLNMADEGGALFREKVMLKAPVLALNMGKAGELEAMSGLGSVFFQFKQVVFKQLSMFDSSALTTKQKLLAAFGLVSFWGFKGIPLAGDALIAADGLWRRVVSDDPKDAYGVSDPLNTGLWGHNKRSTEWIVKSLDEGNYDLFSWGRGDDKVTGAQVAELILKKGGIYALSKGELDVVNRVALGSFFSEAFNFQSGWDFIVSVAVAKDYISAIDQLKDILGDQAASISSYLEVMARMHSGQDFAKAMIGALGFSDNNIFEERLNRITKANLSSALRATGKVFSQLGSFSRIVDSNNMDIHSPMLDY